MLFFIYLIVGTGKYGRYIMKGGTLCCVATVLLIIGGLNLGIVGTFDYNVLQAVFGDGTVLTKIVYIAIGLSALYKSFCFFHKDK